MKKLALILLFVISGFIVQAQYIRSGWNFAADTSMMFKELPALPDTVGTFGRMIYYADFIHFLSNDSILYKYVTSTGFDDDVDIGSNDYLGKNYFSEATFPRVGFQDTDDNNVLSRIGQQDGVFRIDVDYNNIGTAASKALIRIDGVELFEFNKSGFLNIMSSTPFIDLEDTDTNANCRISGSTATGSIRVQADQNDEVNSSRIFFDIDGNNVGYFDDDSTLYLNNGLDVAGDASITGTLTASNFSGTSSGTNTGDQDLSGLVPYIGATGDVNVGVNNYLGNNLTLTGNIAQGDSDYHYFGAGNDANLVHDGSNFYINNGTGDTYVNHNFVYYDNDAVYFGTGKDSYISHTGSNMIISNTVGLININNSNVNFTEDIYQGDNDLHYFGSGNDANVGHDGSNFNISNSTGDVEVLGSDINIEDGQDYKVGDEPLVQLFSVKVTLTGTDLTSSIIPLKIIDAAGSGKAVAIDIGSSYWYWDYVSPGFSNTTIGYIYPSGETYSDAYMTTVPTINGDSGSDSSGRLGTGHGNDEITLKPNSDMYFRTDSNYDNGNGTLTLYVVYRVITL